MTQLQTINTENYAAMAQLMGVSGATPQKAKSSTLPRLRIWNQGVKEKDGRRTVEIIPSGFFRLEVPDTAMYFAEKVTIRPFVQRFMYKKYDSAKNTYVKTVMHDNLNVDLKDTSGGFNCGKPAGYIQDFNSLSDEMKDAIKQIKRVRVILGEVTMHGALDDKGNAVDVPISPFIYEVENKTAYKDMGEPFSQMARQKRLPLQHNIDIETTEQELPTGASFSSRSHRWIYLHSLRLRKKITRHSLTLLNGLRTTIPTSLASGIITKLQSLPRKKTNWLLT